MQPPLDARRPGQDPVERYMVLLFMKANLKNILKGHKTLILNVAWSLDGKLLASAGLDGLIRLWNMEENGEPAGMLEGYTNFALCLAWGSDNTSLAAGTFEKTVDIWDWGERKIRLSLKGHREAINTLSWSSDNGLLASGSCDGEVKIWNVISPVPLQTLKVDNSYVQAVLFSPDGKILAAGSRDGVVRLWSAETFSLLETLGTGSAGIYSLAWSRDGDRLAWGCGNGDIGITNYRRGRPSLLKGHQGPVTGLSFSAGLNILASKSKDHTVRVWDSDLLTDLHVFDETHSGYNQANLGFHPTRPTLAVLAHGEKRIKIWELDVMG